MMDKIYNLQKTIYNDKIAIKEIERELAFRKSILSAHEKALERALSPKEYSPFSEEKPLHSVAEKQETPKERITLENWTSLGIEVGDQVEIVVSGDDDFIDGEVREIIDVERNSYEYSRFIKLTYNNGYSGCWCDYKGNGKESEIYLIRTKDGSGS